jgi:hypothetical protein
VHASWIETEKDELESWIRRFATKRNFIVLHFQIESSEWNRKYLSSSQDFTMANAKKRFYRPKLQDYFIDWKLKGSLWRPGKSPKLDQQIWKSCIASLNWGCSSFHTMSVRALNQQNRVRRKGKRLLLFFLISVIPFLECYSEWTISQHTYPIFRWIGEWEIDVLRLHGILALELAIISI